MSCHGRRGPSRSRAIDLGSDSIARVFVSYAVPSVLGLLVMNTAFIVDGIIVGRFVGPFALAAINLTFPLIMVLSGIGAMIGTGGATLANIRRGAERTHEASGLYTVTLLMLAAFGILTLSAGELGLALIPTLLGADESVDFMIVEYLGVIFLFAPFFIGVFAQDLFIRGDGHPVFPALVLIAGSVANMVLDYLFVGVLGWGIAGAAWATGLSQVGPFGVMMWYLVRRTCWSLTWVRFPVRTILRMLYNGVSELVDQASFGVSHYVLNLVLMARIGSLGVAAFSIAAYAFEFTVIVFFGIAQAIHPPVSFNYGAHNMVRVKRFRDLALAANLSIGLAGFALLQVFGSALAGVFVADPDVVDLASRITFFLSFALVLAGINTTAATFLTSVDRPTESAVIALNRSLIALLVGLFALPLAFGLTGIWLTYAFAESVTFLLVLVVFRRTRLFSPA